MIAPKSKKEVKSPLRWRMKHVSSSNAHVPAQPGLYAIGHDETCLGLEVGRVYVYIGQTDNLRRRLEQHAPVKEKNPGLRKYLQANVGEAKYWFAIADKKDLTKMERQLIRRFTPQYNTKDKPRKESD